MILLLLAIINITNIIIIIIINIIIIIIKVFFIKLEIHGYLTIFVRNHMCAGRLRMRLSQRR